MHVQVWDLLALVSHYAVMELCRAVSEEMWEIGGEPRWVRRGAGTCRVRGC